MRKLGKRYAKAREVINDSARYRVDEAMDVLEKCPKAKFDETVEVSVRLGVDPKHSDQMVRGSVPLPHGTGRTVRVAVIAKGEKEKEAQTAGADVVGGDEMIAKIQGGWFEFDRLIATPDVMGMVGKLGSILGPRGLMPNPKTGTVTFDVAKAIKEIKAGKVDYKVDKSGIVHTVIGKASFGKDKLKANFMALMDSIVKAKPQTSKGVYVRSVTISTTMGPGVRLDPVAFSAAHR